MSKGCEWQVYRSNSSFKYHGDAGSAATLYATAPRRPSRQPDGHGRVRAHERGDNSACRVFRARECQCDNGCSLGKQLRCHWSNQKFSRWNPPPFRCSCLPTQVMATSGNSAALRSHVSPPPYHSALTVSPRDLDLVKEAQVRAVDERGRDHSGKHVDGIAWRRRRGLPQFWVLLYLSANKV